jgi:predicted transcriptional regulator
MSMKTAISLPEDLFLQAEAAAKKLRVSRSQLYAKAIAEFLERSQADNVTARLNEVYSGKPSGLHPALHRAQLKSLGKDSW